MGLRDFLRLPNPFAGWGPDERGYWSRFNSFQGIPPAAISDNLKKETGKRELGRASESQFDELVRELPKVSNGWFVVGKKVKSKTEDNADVEGYYVQDPWGGKWTLGRLTDTGRVELNIIQPPKSIGVIPEKQTEFSNNKRFLNY